MQSELGRKGLNIEKAAEKASKNKKALSEILAGTSSKMAVMNSSASFKRS